MTYLGLNHGCGKDAPGNLAHYLCERASMHAWVMPGKRHDIGSLNIIGKHNDCLVNDTES